jgi:hypothetical protein
MTNLTAAKPYVKPLLVLHWDYPILQIQTAGHIDTFDVAEFDARDGRGFHLSNPNDPDQFVDTFIHEKNSRENFCTCIESLAGKCSHMAAIGHLVEAGLIESPYEVMPSMLGEAPF